MASQGSAPPESAKSEEPAPEDVTMEDAAVTMNAENMTGPVLNNEMLKVMKGVVDYLTEYRDEK
jgi:hypothetical protein